MDKEVDAGFPRRYRIVRGAEYRALYDRGRKLHSTSFVLFGRENKLEHHRLGLTVSRKIGGAVVRNRIKRLFREVFRTTRLDIPHHFDFVVNARRDCRELGFEGLRREFTTAALRFARAAETAGPSPHEVGE